MPSERIRAMEFADFLDEWLYLALPPGPVYPIFGEALIEGWDWDPR